ncbi:probable E3 SUMO-protein ligase RNF212 [Cynocephalus volans]|uniref:probable E3 SUMO-protein ligase RNF212 n=1 Tax=Cynocephalus volans TaxID=110931 RepID=UPI002FC719BE
MASWVFCNCCFQPPSQASCFSLTNCGHVYCEACLGKGKKDECMICKVPCRTVLLSKHTNSEIQTFFMDIDDLCKKFSRDMSQILEFQEMHRKRLLAFYREQISMLEESLRTSWLRIEELWSMRSSQQAAFSPIRNSVSSSTPQIKSAVLTGQPAHSIPAAKWLVWEWSRESPLLNWDSSTRMSGSPALMGNEGTLTQVFTVHLSQDSSLTWGRPKEWLCDCDQDSCHGKLLYTGLRLLSDPCPV